MSTSATDSALIRLLTDFPFYSESVLKIKTKSEGVVPFKLNQPQRYLHDVAEAQKKSLGYVRILVLKGRQEGISTYIAGRYYWLVTKTKGKNALVIAHDSWTTELLFKMTGTFHDECPKEIKQTTKKASAKEFDFDDLNSNYFVQTAGSKQGGRGGTVQLLHGSEVAFWGDADEIFSGVMQSIPSGLDIDGSEVFLESTANGEQGRFYEMWNTAEEAIARGETPKYLPVFLPWFWMENYRVRLPESYLLTDEEKEYKKLYDLDDDQVLWRRDKKQTDFILDPSKFEQEYPATATEAFQTSLQGAFFNRQYVMNARDDKGIKTFVGARVGALDVGGESENSDRTAIGHGDDLCIDNIEYWEPADATVIADKAVEYIKKYDLQLLWIDAMGIGAGVVAIMKRKGYGRLVRPFISNAPSTESLTDPSTGKVSKLYENKRAEGHGKFRDWLGDGTLVQIPRDQNLYVDILKPREERHSKSNAILVESKRKMRERGVSSPDGLDVCIMMKCEEIPESLNLNQNSVVIDTMQNFDSLKEGLYTWLLDQMNLKKIRVTRMSGSELRMKNVSD